MARHQFLRDAQFIDGEYLELPLTTPIAMVTNSLCDAYFRRRESLFQENAPELSDWLQENEAGKLVGAVETTEIGGRVIHDHIVLIAFVSPAHAAAFKMLWF